MKSLKNEALENIKRKNQLINRWWMILALVLLTASVIVPSSLGAQVALADGDGESGHNFNVTFTKWITTFPNMAGVVGGDVGTGTFQGYINTITPPGTVITNIDALYHVNGAIHSFDAHVFVTQNNVTGTAVIVGVVTGGWLEGSHVNGEYKIISCPDKTFGVCFQGTLHIT